MTVDHWIARAFCEVRAFLRGPQTCGAASETPNTQPFKAKQRLARSEMRFAAQRLIITGDYNDDPDRNHSRA